MPDTHEIEVKDGKGRTIRIKYTGDMPSDSEIGRAWNLAFAEGTPPAKASPPSPPPAQPSAPSTPSASGFLPAANVFAGAGLPTASPTFAPAPSLTAIPQTAPPLVSPLGGAAPQPIPRPDTGKSAPRSPLGFRPAEDATTQIQAFQKAHPPVSDNPGDERGAILRAGAHSALPAAAMMGTARAVANFVPTPAGKALALLLGVGASSLTAFLQDKAAEGVLSPAHFKDLQEQLGKDQQEHPGGAFLGEQLPFLLTGKPGFSLNKQGLIQAGAGAAINAGTDASLQGIDYLLHGTPFSLPRLGGAAAVGAVLSGEHNAAGETMLKPVDKFTARFRPPPAKAGIPGVAPQLPADTPPGDLAGTNAPGNTSVAVPGERSNVSGQKTADYNVGDIRFSGDGKPVEIREVRPDGKLRVQVKGDKFSSVVTPEQLAANSFSGRQQHGVTSGNITDYPTSRPEDRAGLRDALMREMGLTQGEAEAEAGRFDSAAQTWAAQTGRPLSDYYRSQIAGVVNGSAELAKALGGGGKEQGAVVPTGVKDDPARLVLALNAPDASTGRHELGHLFLHNMAEEDPESANAVARWALGYKGAKVSDAPKVVQERFAKAFETWDKDGTTPVGFLQNIFQRFGRYLGDAYGRLRGAEPDLDKKYGFNKEVLDLLKKYHTPDNGNATEQPAPEGSALGTVASGRTGVPQDGVGSGTGAGEAASAQPAVESVSATSQPVQPPDLADASAKVAPVAVAPPAESVPTSPADPLFQRGKKQTDLTQEELRDHLSRVPFAPPTVHADALTNRPDLLHGMLDFMAAKREKLLSGTLTPRDVAKAYAVTVGSQRTQAMGADVAARKFAAAGVEVPLDGKYLGTGKDGTPTVRAEDAISAWLGTDRGKAALDAADKGEFKPELWADAAKIQRAFGIDQFAHTNSFGSAKPGAFNFGNLHELTAAINATKGDPSALRSVVSKINGVGEAKRAWFSHFLGAGGEQTLDARKVNAAFTGQGRIGGLKTPGAEAARRFRDTNGATRDFILSRIRNHWDEQAQKSPMADFPEWARGAIFHQLAWDAAANPAGVQSVHDHAGLYDALTLFQNKKPDPARPLTGLEKIWGAGVKVGTSFTARDGRRYAIEALDPANGTARVAITDRDGNKAGVIPAAPLARYQREIGEARLRTAGRNAADVASVPRSIQSSSDLSAAGRQGWILSLSHPGLAVKAFGKQLTSLRNVNFEAWKQEMAARPNAKLYEESGLYLAHDESGATRGEEAFLSNLAAKLPPVAASERAYVAFLDNLRADVFDKYADALGPGAKPEQLSDAAKFINSASGRGELPKALENASGVLSALFYAPRYAASRVFVLNPAEYMKLDAAVRKMAAGDALKAAAAVGAMISLLRLSGAEVETDYNSPDFLKVRYGKYRYDLTAGLAQYPRFALRFFAALASPSGGTPEQRLKKAAGIAGKFAWGKMSPAASFVTDAAMGHNVVGEKFNLGGAVTERFTPLVAQDLWKSYQEDGAEGVARMSPTIFGVGVSAYEDRPAQGGRRFRPARGAGGSASGFMPKMPTLPELPKMP